MATVKLTNVKKVYGKNVVAVQDFNLDIEDKEFVVFVGPSGCGKSTTLRMIAGLEEITEGTIEIDGRVVNDLQPRDRDIAMVFQNYALYPHLTVFENMAFSLRLRKMKQDEVYKRVTEAAEILGITEYLTRKPRALSGGQKQRVAIGRAMVRDSKVFLMDEPLSNLDAKLRNQMRAELILLRQKIDTTFIYVTHDQTEAMTLGDRIVIMKDGFIQQIGTPTEVFDMPKNLFVAEFVGAPKMNIFRTSLSYKGGRYYVAPHGSRMEVDGEKGEILRNKRIKDREVLLGVRPEHIALTKEGDPAAIACKVLVNEMMGSEIYLHVLTEDETEVIVRVQTITLSEEDKHNLGFGKTVYITFESKAMHLFDPETSLNIISEVIGAYKPNHIQGGLLFEDDRYFVTIQYKRIELDAHTNEALTAKHIPVGEYLLRVNPEDITMAASDDPAAFPCKILESKITDSEICLHLLTADESEIFLRTDAHIFSEEDRYSLASANAVYVTVDGGAICFLDPETLEDLLA